jgi:hypothetical protein
MSDHAVYSNRASFASKKRRPDLSTCEAILLGYTEEEAQRWLWRFRATNRDLEAELRKGAA